MEITWITQGGFILEHENCRLVIDPYLSDVVETTIGFTRLQPAPIDVETLAPTLVFCSHDHADHLDPLSIPQIAERYPLCRFIGPQSVADKLSQWGIDPKQIKRLEDALSFDAEGFRLISTPAFHSDPHAIGLVIEVNRKRIYLSGDSLYKPDLAQSVLDRCNGDIDLVLICINGKLNNMDVDEALEVVRQINPEVAAPMHYGLFSENTDDPGPFVSGCHDMGINPYLFTVGKTVNLYKILQS